MPGRLSNKFKYLIILPVIFSFSFFCRMSGDSGFARWQKFFSILNDCPAAEAPGPIQHSPVQNDHLLKTVYEQAELKHLHFAGSNQADELMAHITAVLHFIAELTFIEQDIQPLPKEDFSFALMRAGERFHYHFCRLNFLLRRHGGDS